MTLFMVFLFSFFFLHQVVFLRLISVNLTSHLIHLLNVIPLQILSLLKFSNLNFNNAFAVKMFDKSK